MHFPGQQLMVVSAKYAAPSLLNEKLIQRKYQDAYVDLNSASERATRIIFEDLKANGIARTKMKDQPPDAYEAQGKTGRLRLRLAQAEDARKTTTSRRSTRADEEYARVLALLLEEAKKP